MGDKYGERSGGLIGKGDNWKRRLEGEEGTARLVEGELVLPILVSPAQFSGRRSHGWRELLGRDHSSAESMPL